MFDINLILKLHIFTVAAAFANSNKDNSAWLKGVKRTLVVCRPSVSRRRISCVNLCHLFQIVHTSCNSLFEKRSCKSQYSKLLKMPASNKIWIFCNRKKTRKTRRNKKIMFVTEKVLKNCSKILVIRKRFHLKFQNVNLPLPGDEIQGYHTKCFGDFSSIDKKYKLTDEPQQDHPALPTALQAQQECWRSLSCLNLLIWNSAAVWLL